MELKLYDTLTREKRVFIPLDPGNVRMYVCGPTVYDFAHIGNARPVIVFDVLFRLLRHLYGKDHVTYVRNITDVDDKINARAADEYPGLPLNEAIRKVTEKTDKQFHEDVAALGCLPPTVEPRATEHIAEMKTLIERLMGSGHAYVADNHVLFEVPSMPDYGQLSKRPLDELIAGARVEVAPYKEHPQDFVLWKPSKPGEPAWPSPANIVVPGRPGWHIECSAMSWKYLGETFDIHGGGIDLVFPHHEDEIAQSRCAFHTSLMANFWMHNGFLEVEGRKMAKSEGNFITLHDLLNKNKFGQRKWNGEILRFAMLQTHYPKPIDWTVRLLEQSEARLTRWKDFAAERISKRQSNNLRREFMDALCDDLNTPAAFAAIDRACNRDIPSEDDRYTVSSLLNLLGFRNRKDAVVRLTDTLKPVISGVSQLNSDDWAKMADAIVVSDDKDIAVSNDKDKGAPEAKFFASFEALSDYIHKVREAISRESLFERLESLERGIKSRLPPSSDNYQPQLTPGYIDQIIQEWLTREGMGGSRYVTNYFNVRHRASLPPRTSLNANSLRVSEAEKLLGKIGPVLGSLSKRSDNDWRELARNVSRRPALLNGEPKTETRLLAYLMAIEELGRRLRNYLVHNEGRAVSGYYQEYARKLSKGPSAKVRQIENLISIRNVARKARDFETADRIRIELSKLGVEIKDSKDPETGEPVTTWETAR